MNAEQCSRRVEYCTLKLGRGDIEQRLNDLAADVWEVVEPIRQDGHAVAFLLEREVGGDRGE